MKTLCSPVCGSTATSKFRVWGGCISNSPGKCSQERLIRDTVTSTNCRAAHPSGYARCGAALIVRHLNTNLLRVWGLGDLGRTDRGEVVRLRAWATKRLRSYIEVQGLGSGVFRAY